MSIFLVFIAHANEGKGLGSIMIRLLRFLQFFSNDKNENKIQRTKPFTLIGMSYENKKNAHF